MHCNLISIAINCNLIEKPENLPSTEENQPILLQPDYWRRDAPLYSSLYSTSNTIQSAAHRPDTVEEVTIAVHRGLALETAPKGHIYWLAFAAFDPCPPSFDGWLLLRGWEREKREKSFRSQQRPNLYNEHHFYDVRILNPPPLSPSRVSSDTLAQKEPTEVAFHSMVFNLLILVYWY